MGRTSAKQRYEAYGEWLVWFNKQYGRTKKTKVEQKKETTDKSFKVNIKGFGK